MKVPHEVVGRTRISGQGMNYLRPAVADVSAIGRGLNALGAGFSAMEEKDRQFVDKARERQERTDRFNTLTQFSDFELQVKQELVELKRNAPVDGQGFTKQASDYYDTAEAKFLANLPSRELQEEFKYRARQVRAGVLADSINFQYEAGDANYRTGIKKVLQRSLTGLDPATGGDPRQLERYRAMVHEAIDTSDLGTLEKETLKLETSIAMEGVAYKQVHKNNLRAGAINLDTTIGNVIDEAANRYGVDPQALRVIAWLESKGNPNAKNPKSSAGGLFQFLDDTARQYALRNKYDAAESADAGARLARDNSAVLERALGRKPTTGELYLAHQQGAQGAVNLLTNPTALATSIVGYKQVMQNGGAPGMTAQAFANLWLKKAGDAVPNLDDSPAFANLPYDQRIALQQEAEQEINQEDKAAKDAYRLRIDTNINELLQGLSDGTKGPQDIQMARMEGILDDFADRKRVEDHYAKITEDQRKAAAFTNVLTGGGIFNPMDEDQVKGYNEWAKPGMEAIARGDAAYVNQVLVPTVQRIHDIAPDIMGHLTTQARSSNMQQAAFALDTLEALERADPRAFATRATDSLAKDVDFYRKRRGEIPMEKIMEMLYGGTGTEDRTNIATLRKTAQDILQKTNSGTATFHTKVEAFKDQLPGWSSVNVVARPAFEMQLSVDYQEHFEDGYVLYGNEDEANEYATKVLNGMYGISNATGLPMLMKWPPEMVGYPAFDGSHSWIENHLRSELALAPSDQPQLVSDDQTKREYDLWKIGQGPAPSYMVVVKDADGVYRLNRTPDGKVDRRFFKPGMEEFAREATRRRTEEAIFRKKDLEERLRNVEAAISQSTQAVPEAGQVGGAPEELTQQAEELRRQLGEVQGVVEPEAPPPARSVVKIDEELTRALEERHIYQSANQPVPPEVEAKVNDLRRQLEQARKRK